MVLVQPLLVWQLLKDALDDVLQQNMVLDSLPSMTMMVLRCRILRNTSTPATASPLRLAGSSAPFLGAHTPAPRVPEPGGPAPPRLR